MNINDIAEMAGVSRATVSRYLNGGYVSQEKKDSIRRVIEETGYEPSRQAQMLRTKKTRVIGVVIPRINSDSISRMVEGISKVLLEAGYQLLLANTQNQEQEELNYFQTLKNYHVDGIILVGTIFTKAHKRALKELDIPVVILAQQLDGYPCVYYDDRRAAYELTGYMLKESKNPGYIGVTLKDQAAGFRRREGFCEACSECRIICPPENMEEADFSMESGYEHARELFERSPQIDAVFCATDQIAYGAVLYLRETGRSIPQDVQVAGIGDSLIGRLMEPKLTTAHYFYKTSGMEAAKMLLGLVKEQTESLKEVKMGHRLELRDSTWSK
ncbi:Catabolite control protein [uncultured Roseburia sp.]|uniref:LacI family DNA-binding transcriptional regulator n=1 Tax=Brotonthovivens ammoniilytica TaxID=2981725 RepID=A0ABT2TQ54_9FIRM|nr:LacI family DNA-binding transcriptional regulator [Brotonthovivens ammoniilytica]MCU6763742.1 LacI family DNA-binding transcriptional regulator [Brotonthovivens ammoniilytica]SCJ33451.1 Catabolite control protein [uncultured Roseburia sp.]